MPIRRSPKLGFDFPQADIVIGAPMAKLQLHVCQ